MNEWDGTDVPTVFLVDDDDAVRIAMSRLFESAGLACRPSTSGSAFLNDYTPAMFGCLVLDIRMPGISGLELQRELIAQDSTLPIIFMTGHGDLQLAVRAMRLGAMHFLRKPVDDQELLDSIQQGFMLHAHSRERRHVHQMASALIESLTERERQIFERVSDGQPNKIIARDLGITRRTVEVHRSHVMRKLNATSLAELIHLRLDASSA